jgi:hypothetical protein
MLVENVAHQQGAVVAMAILRGQLAHQRGAILSDILS